MHYSWNGRSGKRPKRYVSEQVSRDVLYDLAHFHGFQLLDETQTMLRDPDASMRAMAEEEYTTLTEKLSAALETTFPKLLIPASEDTSKLSAYIELKAGVGGSEASLFVDDLMRMYIGLSQTMNWTTTTVSSNEIDGGGLRDALLEVRGENAYDSLRWETGVHRVQRVPATETKGRTHTSTVAVIVSERLTRLSLARKFTL